MVKGHEETIWDLKYHPIEQKFLSSGADGKIKMWSVEVNEEYE